MQQQEQRRNDDELFSPARKALSDSLRRQHIDERSSDEFEFEFEWEDGGGAGVDDADDDSSSSTSTLSSSRFDAARLLAPNRDEEIRVFGRRSSFSPGRLPLPASSMKRSRLDSGAGTTAPSSRSSSRSGSVGSSEGGPPAQLKKSYSVTMMMENSALRALHENDAMKVIFFSFRTRKRQSFYCIIFFFEVALARSRYTGGHRKTGGLRFGSRARRKQGRRRRIRRRTPIENRRGETRCLSRED